ncbi:MAG: hypothetical protein BECKG1743D_GA0114223_107264 [Candidatus Kentron sp. G]|nr:MAG: hypothetical protein BECKG1743F_GA0114225_107482 [Candidatus Kentron sp. G]VFN04285.1 MAG: hypothetical protein BECKG1743E_GA0114224_107124 [Candidatus Kentron sp. G]VFN05497.1 MAG: hypothetical protein BECKG1743D_GA0114223_107264 [Candidatus Kentron sp. G]
MDYTGCSTDKVTSGIAEAIRMIHHKRHFDEGYNSHIAKRPCRRLRIPLFVLLLRPALFGKD